MHNIERYLNVEVLAKLGIRSQQELERQRLIGLAVSGFNHTRTMANASAKGLDARQDDYNKGMCSPKRLGNTPVR